MSQVISSAGNFLGSSSGGATINAIGGVVKGIGEVFNAKQEADVGDFNARILQQKAEAQRQSQELLEQQKRRAIDARIGTQVALYGKSGVKFTGSAIDVVANSLANAEMDLAIDKYNSEVKARGLENEARIVRSEGRQRSAVGFTKAGSTFLSTAVDIFKSTQKLGGRGTTLGAGTTSRGIKVPSRFVPSR